MSAETDPAAGTAKTYPAKGTAAGDHPAAGTAESFPRPLGPYLLLGQVGRGGMGDVYLAKHGLLLGFEKHCVLKMLRDDRASDELLLSRFADEARVVVQLSHRNICPVFDVGRVGARLYVAMEHVVGRDLRSVAVAGLIPTPIALHIVSEVLEALDYAHRFVDVKSGAPLGIVHRDVSPHNVLLGVDGDTKLIDFGIATTAGQAPVESDPVLGKLSYMSPEHACAEVVDGRADQFATAIMLAELLIGERFHQGLTQQQMWENAGIAVHRPSCWPDLDADLRAILDKALAVIAADRFASCADFGDALSSWARSHGQFATPRDVRRHLKENFGDLAADHRQILRAIDVDHFEAPIVAGPGALGFDGQFESIATTLALPAHTPAFGNAPATVVSPPPRNEHRPRLEPPALPSARRLFAAAAAGLLMGVAGTALSLGALHHVAAVPVEPVAVPVEPVAVPVPAPMAPAMPDLVELPSVEPTATTPTPPAPQPVSVTVTAPRTSRSPSLDADTRSDLAYLRECLEKVPCAKGLIDWSRRSPNQSERAQLKEAASDCAKRCRLK